MAYVDGLDLRELLRREGPLDARARRRPARARSRARSTRRTRSGSCTATSSRATSSSPATRRASTPTSATSGSPATSRRSAASPASAASSARSTTSRPSRSRAATIDGRADVYSLGCMLFECLAGERPFERESELAVVFAHLNEPPPRLDRAAARAARGARRRDREGAREGAGRPLRELRRARGRGGAALRGARLRRGPRRRARVVLAASRRRSSLAAAAVGGRSLARRAAAAAAPAPAARDRADDARLVDARTHASRRARSASRASPWDVVVRRPLGVGAARRRAAARARRPRARTMLSSVAAARSTPGGSRRAAAPSGSPRTAGPGLVRISTRRTGRLARSFRSRPGRPRRDPTGIALGAGSLWVARGSETVARRSRERPRSCAASRRRSRRRPIVFADGALWVASAENGRIVKIDPDDRPSARRPRPARHGHRRRRRRRRRSGPRSSPTTSSIRLGERDLRVLREAPRGPAGRSDLVGRRQALGREQGRADRRVLDPRRARGGGSRIAGAPSVAAYHGGLVWASAGRRRRCRPPSRARAADPAAGRLRSRSAADLALAARSTQLEYATCAGLLAYPGRGRRGGQHAPARGRRGDAGRLGRRAHVHLPHPPRLPLLAAVERAGDGGDLQAHARARVLAEARRAGRARPERARPRPSSGSRAYRAGKAAHVSGITARGDTLSITLVKPSGDFLDADLAAATSAPFRSACPIRPATAPDARRHRGAVLRRRRAADGRVVLLPNPGYGGDAAAPRGADRLHARRPDDRGRGARRPRRARLPAGGLRQRPAAARDAAACSTAATGLRARPPSTGRSATSSSPAPGVDYIVLNADDRSSATRACAGRAATTRSTGRRSRACSTTAADQIVPPARRRLPGRRGLSARRPRPRRRPAARRRAGQRRTARSSSAATTVCARSPRS